MSKKKYLNKRLPTCIIYTRVSSREQTEGFSLDSQAKICQEFAVKNELTIVKVFCERGESAKTAERTQLQNLMKFVADNKNKIGTLLIYKVDRLARNNTDYYALKAFFGSYGVEIKSVTENFTNDPAGKFLEGVLSAVAEFDNNNRAERVTTNMKQAAVLGHWTFKAPMGYLNAVMPDGSGRKGIIINPKTAPAIKFIFEEYAKKIYTFRELTEKYNKIFTLQGFKISPQYLVKLLRNPIYCGRIEIPCWEIYVKKAKHQPIIEEQLFDKVQIVLNGGNPHKAPRNRNNPDFPLRGIVCGHCGRSITGGWTTGKMKVRYGYYNCANGHCEERKNMPKEKYENEFTGFLQGLTPIENDLDILKESVKVMYQQERGLMIKNNRQLELEIEKLKNQKEKLIEMKLKDADLISDNDFKNHSQKLDTRIQNLEMTILSTGNQQLDINSAIDWSFSLIKNLPNIWQALDVIDFKALKNILFPQNVSYHYPGFQTPELPFIYRYNNAIPAEKETVVPPRRIELRLPG